ncbi:MAG: DNA polymerase I [Propionibacteriaceae bacterium]|jgi:DNA polymerase-1|nr:DNA polymerase I [Propionibacteriaceae bacterium]
MLIDGHSMAFRAFYGIPPETMKVGTQSTNAVYGFTSMLINLLASEQPTHLAVAFDLSRHSFRTDEYPEYKGTRGETPPEFSGQTELIEQVLTALKIKYLTKENYEADDILATLATKGDKAGFKVLVVTGDRDSLQLVDSNVTVLYPRKGVSDLLRLDPEAVKERYLVYPQHYPELAALVGETSDNLPGVPGVGPKTAAKWLDQYENLDNLLAHAGEIKGKVGESLRAHIGDVKRNRHLNALLKDLDLGVTLDDLARHPWKRQDVHELFDELQFHNLRNRLFAALPGEDTADEVSGAVEYESVEIAPGKLGEWLKSRTGDVAVEADGSWVLGDGEVSGIALASGNQAAWIDPAALSPADEKALGEWLESDSPKIVHDLNTTDLRLSGRGWKLGGVVFDTLLAAYLLNPDQRVYDVADLSIRVLGKELASSEDADGLLPGLDGTAPDEAKLRSEALLELKEPLSKPLEERKQLALLETMELPLSPILASMEELGIAADRPYLDSLRGQYDAEVAHAQEQAYEALGHEINLGSPKQLQAALFDELGMPKTRKTRTGYTTDAAALTELYVRSEPESRGNLFLGGLLRHRDQIKLRQIVDGLIKNIGADGRIHTTFSQTQAATGRLSSAEPNLQNIPTRTDEGVKIRQAFVVGPGYLELLTADYSQIEMRVMADLSGDEKLIDAFNSGADFHAVTASHVFNVPVDKVTHEQRSKVKQMNYGLAYGLSSFGLASRLNVSQAEARKLMDDYFSRFGKVRDYLDSLVAQARIDGYTETISGRRRYLPDLKSDNRQRREMAERSALNAPIQGSAADIIKQAMLDVDKAMKSEHLASRMLLQVHDELIFEVAEGEAEQLEALVRDKMEHAMNLKVGLDVSVGKGRSWRDAAH